LDQLKSQIGDLEPQFDGSEDRRVPEAQKPARRKQEKRDEFLDLMDNSESPESGEPEWEIEIVPPIDIMKIMSIVSHVDGLAGVSRTEIIPRNDRTSIMVYAQIPVDILEALKTLAEVAHAEEMANGQGEAGKPRRVSVALSDKNVGETVRATDDTPDTKR
jgi:hypothetical protein